MSNRFQHIVASKILLPLIVVIGATVKSSAQITPQNAPDTVAPMPSFEERSRKWGPNDTIKVDAIWYNREMLSYKEEPMVWVSKLSGKKLQKYLEEWTRLRNAVYVTYPYARKAGFIMNEINIKTQQMDNAKKKEYIKTREKELKKEFSDPLTNLSVYQGKVLMKLINRQTGNNCYDIIKEYKGGLTARAYQTIAFFFNSSLKQPYEAAGEDKEVESIVKEVERMYR